MASIKQYRGKTWRAIVRRVGFPSQSKTFPTKKDAEAWAHALEAKMGVTLPLDCVSHNRDHEQAFVATPFKVFVPSLP